MTTDVESTFDSSIAIVGMAAKFPGAENIEEFWDNIRNGRESIVDISDEMLFDAGVAEEIYKRSSYVRRAPILADIDKFDAEFFGLAPSAARIMDPQHRIFLQSAWSALEDACCDPYEYDGAIGVFGSCAASGYLLHNLLSHADLRQSIAHGSNAELLNLLVHNDKDYLATRVSHQFNLRGPSLTVQTACSSSLVAVHMACQSLLSNECDMALAGAASIRIPHNVGYFYEPGSMMSASGHCRPFDSRSDGTVFGSGVGIVVLKRLNDALAAKDRIHAVVAGSAINNDGSRKIAFSAPNVAAQADVIAEAHAVAGVDSADVSYVEAHGTGTPLGDPIELEALRRAFSISHSARSGPCAIGSVKSNIGHLEVTSGVAGLIKAVLGLEHRELPPMLHYEKPNPELNLERTPFRPQAVLAPWDWDGPRIAGVSSFGVGGTNAHVVVTEAPEQTRSSEAGSGPQILLLSARTSEALTASRSRLAAHLQENPVDDLADVAYTLDRGRRRHPVRFATVARDVDGAVGSLTARLRERTSVPPPGAKIVFVLPGQGAQFHGMARDLLEREPVFTEAFEYCMNAFERLSGRDIRSAVFGPDTTMLSRTDYVQPAIFSVEYALAILLQSYGVAPDAVVGHSVGEYAAATVAGIFDLDTAIEVVAARANLMQASPVGAMTAVASAADAIAREIGEGLDIAAINDSNQCVISGEIERVEEFERWAATEKILTRRTDVTRAFHSASMDSVVPKFAEVLKSLSLRTPKIPVLSNKSGTWMSDSEAIDPTMWAESIRAAVRFDSNVATALEGGGCVFVEVGPGGSLSTSVKRNRKWAEGSRAIRLMRRKSESINDHDAFLSGLAELWTAGVEVDWTSLRADAAPRWLPLPTYPFAQERYWIDAAPAVVKSEVDDTYSIAAKPAEPGRVTTAAPSETEVAYADVRALEAMLAGIAEEVLGVEDLDLDVNFFDLGVDSLMAVGFVRRALEAGADIDPQDLLENQTIRALAGAVFNRSVQGTATAHRNDVVTADTGYEAEVADSEYTPGIGEEQRTEIAALLVGATGDLGPVVSDIEIEDIYPLTPVQQDVLPLVTEAGGAGVFVEQLVATLMGPLDHEHFRQATQMVVHRHSALRTSIVQMDGAKPVQVVRRHATMPFVFEDATSGPAEHILSEAEYLAQDRLRGFDLASAPPTRVRMTKVAEDRHRIVWTHHRMMLDGTSFAMILAEVSALYEQLRAGKTPQPVAARPFRDYVDWAHELDRYSSEEFWRAELSGVTPNVVTGSSAKIAKHSAPNGVDPRVSVVLTEAQSHTVTDALRDQRITLATIAYGAWAAVVGRHGGDSEVTIGAASSGRFGSTAGMGGIVGALSNVIPLRVHFDSSTCGGDWLRSLQAHVTSLRNFEHDAPSDFAFWADLASGTALFETAVAVAVHAFGGMDVGFADVSFEDIDVHLRSDVPIWAMVIPGSRIEFRLIYQPDRLDRDVAAALVEDWASVVGELAIAPDSPLSVPGRGTAC